MERQPNDQKAKRIEKFMEEYKQLTEKYKVDFASYPMFVPNEDSSFKVIVQSTPLDLEEVEKAKQKNFIPK